MKDILPADFHNAYLLPLLLIVLLVIWLVIRARKSHAVSLSQVLNTIAFERITRTPNTIDSHRLLHWAGQAGLQDAVVEVLFQRYFEEGADIGDREVLVAIAAQAGMDGDEVRARFERGDDLELVAAQDTNARQRGVAGVPYFIIAGKYAVSGAQGPSVFLQVLDLAARGADEAEDEAEGEASAATGGA